MGSQQRLVNVWDSPLSGEFPRVHYDSVFHNTHTHTRVLSFVTNIIESLKDTLIRGKARVPISYFYVKLLQQTKDGYLYIHIM